MQYRMQMFMGMLICFQILRNYSDVDWVRNCWNIQDVINIQKVKLVNLKNKHLEITMPFAKLQAHCHIFFFINILGF